MYRKPRNYETQPGSINRETVAVGIDGLTAIRANNRGGKPRTEHKVGHRPIGSNFVSLYIRISPHTTSAQSVVNSLAGMFERSLFLLVEDDDNDVQFVKRAFSRSHLVNPLAVVRNAEEAKAYFMGTGAYKNRAEHPLPSLVLLDLKLPGMDGIEFLKWLRQQPSYGSTRVVILTASTLMRDVNEAYQAGANSFLVKPVDFERFVEITSALSGYWMRADTPPETERPSRERQMNRE